MRIPRAASSDAAQLTPQELRTIVLEGGKFIPSKHRSILLNLFDLEQLTVDDIMTPRSRIEALDIAQPPDAIGRQLMTCYHNKLPVCDGDISRVLGVLHVRKLLPLLGEEELTAEQIRSRIVAPYFIPTGTPLLQQLQMFQDNRQRVGLVVDEYGDVRGLVTLEMAGMRVEKMHAKFLPVNMKSTLRLRLPFLNQIVWAYLRSPFKPRAGQMLAVAKNEPVP